MPFGWAFFSFGLGSAKGEVHFIEESCPDARRIEPLQFRDFFDLSSYLFYWTFLSY